MAVASAVEALIYLLKFDPDNSVHVEELRRQRILCGWNVDQVENWCKKVRTGMKGLEWVMRSDTQGGREYFKDLPLPDREVLNLAVDGAELGPSPVSPDFRPIGHASLDWEDSLNDESLASKSLGNVSFSSFFLLPSQQGRGLGSLVMDLLEEAAASPAFGAKYITLNTLDRDYATDPTFWDSIGLDYDPNRRINEDWYLKRGYEVMRRNVPRYEETNRRTHESVKLNAVYMRKKLIATE